MIRRRRNKCNQKFRSVYQVFVSGSHSYQNKKQIEKSEKRIRDKIQQLNERRKKTKKASKETKIASKKTGLVAKKSVIEIELTKKEVIKTEREVKKNYRKAQRILNKIVEFKKGYNENYEKMNNELKEIRVSLTNIFDKLLQQKYHHGI